VTLTAVVLLAAAIAVRADETPSGVLKTHKTVENNAKMVMSWCYPTVTFDDLGKGTWSSTTNGYALTELFNYTDSDGEKAYRKLVFQLDKSGMITDIQDGGGPSIWKPFTGLRLAKELLAAAAKDAADKEQDADKKKILDLLAKSPEPEEVLALLLNLKTLAQ
jgi:hypothetical protein